MKLLKILTLAICLSASTFANASLMLTDNDYITVDHNGINLDWAWASNYNVNFYYEGGILVNELYAPTEIDGWRESTVEEFNFFTKNITAVDFLETKTGDYKTAIEYFNSNSTLGFSVTDFNRGDISGEFYEDSNMDTVFNYYDSAVFETFYVRNALPQGPKPIPEPLTIIIFATALIALQIKLRKKISLMCAV